MSDQVRILWLVQAMTSLVNAVINIRSMSLLYNDNKTDEAKAAAELSQENINNALTALQTILTDTTQPPPPPPEPPPRSR